jgi:hypothetical protein
VQERLLAKFMETERPPRADDRTEQLVASASPKVQHIARYPNARTSTVRTLCGKLGFFRDPVPFKMLPLCSECERRDSVRWSYVKQKRI